MAKLSAKRDIKGLTKALGYRKERTVRSTAGNALGKPAMRAASNRSSGR